MVTKPKTPTVTQEGLLSTLKVRYDELIELNKIRNTVDSKESERVEQRIAELNEEVQQIEHTLANNRVDKK